MTVLIVMAALATAAALVLGINSMAHGGEADIRRSARLMTARVAFQGLALLLLLLALAIGAR